MIYKASRVFTGYELLEHFAIQVTDGRVEQLLPAATLPGKGVTDLGDVLLAPAFIDIQLYGAYGKLLAVYPEKESVAAIAAYSSAGGAAWSMPTVATNTYETIFKCIDAVKEYWQHGGKGVIGLHVEGPWINPVKKGAHREEWIFKPTAAQAKELLDYGKDVIKLITLAPECVSPDIIELILSYGIVVSAGHSNATYGEATKAFDNGILLSTHLYNAMSPLQHRAPGLVGAILDHEQVLCSLVPDGHHVDFPAIRIAKKIMGNRLFAITDAVTETTEGYYKHKPEGDKYTSNGILSGSALTMHKAFLNLVQHCSIPFGEALRMCSLYPAQALRIQDEIGVLQKGARAAIIVLDKDLQLVQVIT